MELWHAINRLASALETIHKNTLGAQFSDDVLQETAKYAELVGFTVISYYWGFEVKKNDRVFGGVRIEEIQSAPGVYHRNYRMFTKNQETRMEITESLGDVETIKRWLLGISR